MNDNLNDNATPTMAMPITMEDGPAPEPEVEHHVALPLINMLLATFEKHIDMLVETKFAQLVQNHKTLSLMDDVLEDKISNMIAEVLEAHENDCAHPSDEDIENEVDQHLEHFVRQGSHAFITERQLSEKVGDVLVEILDDRINQALSGASIEITV